MATLFELQGRHGATSAALGIVVARALGLDTPADLAMILPPLGDTTPPGVIDTESGSSPQVEVRGVGLSEVLRRPRACLVAERDGSVVTTAVDTADLGPQPVQGLDPALGLVRIATTCDTSGPWEPAVGSWTDAVAAGQRAVAHEMIGAMRTMLDLAREHALDRIQFDRPIGSFQAVRHRLADAHVAIEAADGALAAAWDDATPITAEMAKAIAGHSARTVRRHCQQVLAGIGFTTEHDLHHYVRRTIVLDRLFGDARSLTARIGAGVLEAGRLPALLPL